MNGREWQLHQGFDKQVLEQLLFWLNFWCYIIYSGIMIGAITALFINSDLDL